MDDAFGEFKQWFFSKPLVTRTYLAICVITTLLVTLGFVSVYSIYYTFGQTFKGLQLWRPFTCLFFLGKFDFGFIFDLYFAYIALNKVQTVIFNKEKYPDFIWLCIFNFLCCLILGSLPFLNIFFFSKPFLMAMIYIWCKRLPFEEITFMFGFRVKTGYFPWVYAVCMTLFGGSMIPYLVGIAIGHLYIFIKDIATVRYHRDYLPTPQFIANWWWRYSGVRPDRRGNNNFGGNNNNGGGFANFQGQGHRFD